MNRKMSKLLNPLSLPIIFFIMAIVVGTTLLHSSYSSTELKWIDALFTATSAVCVTGLSVVDTNATFSQSGHLIILTLIQLGGLGIMTFSSLALFLVKRRVSLTDRVAVGQSLLYDPQFHLGTFLVQVFLVTVAIEVTGAALLLAFAPQDFSFFSAVFHSISAFCNAGFSLSPESLVLLQSHWPVNLVFMVLIILGGLGFAVLMEGGRIVKTLFKKGRFQVKSSWHFQIIIKATLLLIAVGWLYLFFAEFIHYRKDLPLNEALLTSLFQSVTCRTAGFNTLNISTMTNASLVFMIFLMFIGGAPGSCAGGIKVTTFCVLAGFIKSQIQGRDQVTLGRYAVDKESINKSLTLLFFSLVIIFCSVIALDFTEGGNIPHPQAKGQFLEIVFEVVSAFGTAGISTGLTTKLSPAGKIIIIVLMFIGRLGPLVLLGSMQSMRTKLLYEKPEEKLPIG